MEECWRGIGVLGGARARAEAGRDVAGGEPVLFPRIESQSRKRNGDNTWAGRMRVWRGPELTPRRLRLSKRCRGTTVTISISQRKATSMGVRPGCKGSAIVSWQFCAASGSKSRSLGWRRDLAALELRRKLRLHY